MKKTLIIVVFFLAVLFLISCDPSPSLFISGQKDYKFSSNGGVHYVTFSSNREWSISSSEPWCMVSPSSGPSSERTITVTISCEANLSYDPRTCSITIAADEVKDVITIEQEAAEGLIATPTSFNLNSSGQTIEFEVQANVEYIVSIASGCESWIRQTDTKALSSKKLAFVISENEQYDAREGSISIAQKNGSLISSVSIIQAQKDDLIVSSSEYLVSEESQAISVEVRANVNYDAIPDVEWIKKVETKALSTSVIALSIEANNSTFSRVGNIVIKQEEGNISSLVTVKQQAHPDLKTESASDISFFESTINGSLVIESAPEVVGEVWFLYSSTAKTVESLISGGVKVFSELEESGKFQKRLSGLSPGTTYYYIACAKVNDRDYYGEVMSFETIDYSATVTTLPATEVGFFNGQIRGSLETVNSDAFTKEVWFQYSSSTSDLNQLLSEGISVSSTLSDDGTFKAPLTELDYATTYFYVACAKVHDREYHGAVQSFTTQKFDAIVTTVGVSDISLYKASLSGKVSFNNADTFAKQAGFLFSDSAQTLEQLITDGSEIFANIDIDNNFMGDLSKLKCETKYFYVAYVKIYDKKFYGKVKSFSTKQLPSDAVDMGLSVAWASCNIGASSPEEYGSYYAWGETETKDLYTWNTYKWGVTERELTKYNTMAYYGQGYGQVDNKTTLELDDDIASVKFRASWRIPTGDEFQELLDNCSWCWMQYKGVAGYTVTSNINGNKLFLPAAGFIYNDFNARVGTTCYYWSSSLSLNMPYSALGLSYNADIITVGPLSRYQGCSVRAVTD